MPLSEAHMRPFLARTASYVLMLGVLYGPAPQAWAAKAELWRSNQLANPYRADRPKLEKGPLLTVPLQHSRGKDIIDRGYLSQKQWKELRSGLQHFFKTVSPHDVSLVAGIGRSPTWLVATLQLLNKDLAVNLPAAKLRDREMDEKIWFPHMDRFIPAAALLDPRPMALVDRSTWGSSLRKTRAMLERYLEYKQAKNRKVITVSYDRHPERTGDFDHRIPIERGVGSEIYDMYLYGNWAQFPEFVVGESSPTLLDQSRAEWSQLKDKLGERMSRDASLGKTIDALNRRAAKAKQ